MKMQALKKLKKLNRSMLNLTKRNIAWLVLPAIFVALVITFSLLRVLGEISLPKTPAEFAKTSVMVTDFNKTTGGTGVILKSSKHESIILTNKHVCGLIEHGGIITTSNRDEVVIDEYKKYPLHDLCLIKVKRDLGINTSIAKSSILDFEKAFISGHPALLPHVLTTGNFSKYMSINIMVATSKCDKTEYGINKEYCEIYHSKPIFQTFSTQLVTGTILPGSSGSAVFNDNGEISGLVFAGNADGLSYAFIVPLPYISDFIESENIFRWRSVLPDLNDPNIISKIFDMQQLCGTLDNCKEKVKYLIWKK
jgi:S1-C subfamily serine protease